MQARLSLKWQVPRQEGAVIERPRLLAQLSAAVTSKLLLVRAPAGFGKTTLIAQWAKTLPEARVAWLTLDEGDSENLLFLREVVLCLVAAGVPMGQLESLAEQDFVEMQPRSILSWLLEQIAQDTRRILLILEDFHRAESGDACTLVHDLIAAAPPNLTVVITSRRLPAIHLPQLAAAGEAVEIAADELRFSLAETCAVARLETASVLARELFERTEGWPIAVQLARLLMRDTGMDIGLIAGLSGHSGHIAAYLADQVLATLAPDLQMFLLHTAVLERFNAPLAGAVCERADCWNLLREAQSLHPLLVPLDEQGEWFRYHPLFGECLRDLSRRKHPERIALVSLRASAWYEHNGYLLEAVAHARIAGDIERAVRLIEDSGGWQLMLYKGIGYVNNLLKQIPEQRLREYPSLLLTRSYLNVKQGRMAEARTAYEFAAARYEHTPKTSVLDRASLNVGTILAMFDDTALESIEPYRRFMSSQLHIEADDSLTLALIDIKRAIDSLGVGRFADADRSAHAAMSAMRRADSILGLNYCYVQSGVSALYQGQLRAALANFEEAQRLANENFGADSTVKGYADVLHGVTLFYQGELDAVAQADFFAALNFVSGNDGSFDIYANGFEVGVELALARGDTDVAAELVEKLRQLAKSFGNARLAHVANALDLIVRIATARHAGTARLVIDAESAFAGSGNEAAAWRVKYVVAQALVAHYCLIDRSKAIAIIERVVTVCRTIEARLHLVQALLIRSELLDLAGHRAAALNDCFEALKLAAVESLRQPFLRKPSLLPLFRAAQKRARAESADILSATFLTSCVEALARNASGPLREADVPLSPREMEVMAELARGLSNKEIARLLDVTENTVKYHLKNIFQKIKADNRTQAITLIRERQAGSR